MRKQRQRHKESEMDESWLLPYSDLLTLLLALFIVLFAMSEVDTQKYKELSQVFKSEFSSGGGGILEQQKPGHDSGGLRAPKTEAKETRDEANDKTENSGALELERLQDVQKDINEYIHANKLDGKIGTRLTDEGLYITIQNGITFTPGSSQVNAKGKKMAKEISRFLETDPPHQIIVAGHTDDTPISASGYKSNWELSVSRALNFMKLLLENSKLAPQNFSAKGYGEFQPLEPNTSVENKQKNRRVEVLIVPNYKITVKDKN